MAGAYVAKPIVVSIPDIPPGWDPDWPRPGDTDVPGYDPDPFFPAPFPPGYSPDYSLAMTASESIAYNGTAAVTGSLRDHLTHATNEPDVIVWTATVSSSPSRSVNLRFSGDEDYAVSISSNCTFGTYWGAAPDIEFELTEEDTGGTIILTARSAISGACVGATLAIEVVPSVAEFTSPVSYVFGGAFSIFSFTNTFRTLPYDADAELVCVMARQQGFAPPTEINTVNDVTETYPYTCAGLDGYIIVTVDDDGVTAEINYANLEDGQYLAITPVVSNFDATSSIVLSLVVGETTYTKTLTNDSADGQWLRITNDGSVTIINP